MDKLSIDLPNEGINYGSNNKSNLYITIYILYKVKTMSSQTQQRIEITLGIRNI